jgi:O-antigen/teichoic acid export membrane protein
MYYASLFIGKISGTQLIYAKKTYITSLLSLIGIFINVSLNIPMIIKWGALGAAWATMISGIIITAISYRIAQHYAPVQWEWKPMLWMYSIFIVAAMVVLQIDMLITSYIHVLMIKIVIIMSYLFLGMKLQIVTLKNMYNLYNNNINLFRGNLLQH